VNLGDLDPVCGGSDDESDRDPLVAFKLGKLPVRVGICRANRLLKKQKERKGSAARH
jgi:hypothetical protein